MKRAVCCIAATLACISSAQAQVPLPSDLSVAAPAPEVRPEIAAFSGRWIGNWSGKLESVLIVEVIGTETADVLYAWGDAPQWNTRAGYARFKATIAVDGKNSLSFATSGATVVFTATMNQGLQTISVQRTTKQGSLVETFKKVP